jgi:hypothetical protein
MVQVDPTVVSPPIAARRRRPLRTHWLPVALVALLAIVTLHAYAVPLSQIGIFSAYIVIGVTVPGMLWWRALSGMPRWPAVDLAAGTALGYALEVLAYIPLRCLDVPQAFLAWAGVTYFLFTVVPGLRRHWVTRREPVQPPLGWSWTMAGLIGFAILYSAVTVFRGHGLSWPRNGAPYVDIPWHLALAGEIKHHLPAMLPYVVDEALRYHWFVYADLAATSWATGLELQTLLLRLSLMPMIAAFTILIAVVAYRLTGRWWTGVATVVITFFVTAPNPYAWTDAMVPSQPGPALPWLSPTQAFGALLFVPLVLLVIDLMRRPRGSSGRWALTAVLMLAEAGAKATFLPLLLAGVVLILAVHLFVRRRVHRAAVMLAGLCLGMMAFAHLVVFQGESQGLRVAPFDLIRGQEARLPPGAGLLPSGQDGSPALLLLVAIHVVSWAAVWGVAVALPRRRPWRNDPAVVLLAGVGMAGIGATSVLGHPGLSQVYFLTSAAPYLTILAAAGLSVTLPWERPWATVVLSGAAGGASVWAVQSWVATTPPWNADVLAARAVPYALLMGAAAVVALVLPLTGRRGLVGVVVPIFALGCGLYSGCAQRLQQLGDIAEPVRRSGPEWLQIPDGGVRAARWLRDHSSPADLIAVNAHCRSWTGTCDNRHFWISAYTERRVLVEGWGYTLSANSRASLSGPPGLGLPGFQRPTRLADNDAAFLDPTRETVGKLGDTYGVRWLFVDDRYPVRTDALGRLAALRFRAGRCWVYEVTEPHRARQGT